VIVALNSAAGFAAYAGSADLEPGTAAAVTGAAALAAVLAARVGPRLPEEPLRRGFAVLVLVVAVAVLGEVLYGAITG
jgi:uncharacterized membrane protein YfcA